MSEFTELKIEPLTRSHFLSLWTKTYNKTGKPDWSHIFPYYHEDIIFQDTIQRIEGKEKFVEMCNRLTDRCERLEMEISSVSATKKEIFMDWKMTMIFRKTPNTPIHGCSKLTLGEDGRIIHQRDYYDLWGDIFKNVPMMKKIYPKFMHKLFG
jgi:limonene-1,2-epoxide hydrolase